jgi:hypothetical protein
LPKVTLARFKETLLLAQDLVAVAEAKLAKTLARMGELVALPPTRVEDIELVEMLREMLAQ